MWLDQYHPMAAPIFNRFVVLGSMFGFSKGRVAPPSDKVPGVEILRPPAAIYAIGDIHGCLDKLKRLEAKIVEDAEAIVGDKLIITLGDYIDRGPSSAQTLNWLMRTPPHGFNRICLRGNHEAAFLAALEKPAACRDWLSWGGRETLSSYGIDPESFERLSGRERGQVLGAFVSEEQIAFLKSCPYYVSVPGFLFVHAGVRPGIPMPSQKAEDFMWIREPFLSKAHGLSALVVHGHTPAIEPSITDYRIGIDTGAFDGGPLTALRVLANGEIAFLQAV